MEIISNIRVEFDIGQLMRSIRARKLSEKEISAIVEECRPLIEPKAVYAFEKVKRIENDYVYLESGNTLNSIILSDTLEKEQTIVPYVVTVGPRLEEKASETSKTSMIQSWVMEGVADYALRTVLSGIQSRMKEKLGDTLSAFGPGTGTGRLFGINQQEVLFKILDPSRTVGVQLTPSYLMVPRKSVSGILASTRREYVACQYCPREKCQNRRKPFSGEYNALNCEHETE